MSWTDATPVADVRFVVLDTETTGLNPRKDRIVTMGAVAVVGREILIEDSFEALVFQRLPRLAERSGRTTPGELCEACEPEASARGECE